MIGLAQRQGTLVYKERDLKYCKAGMRLTVAHRALGHVGCAALVQHHLKARYHPWQPAAAGRVLSLTVARAGLSYSASFSFCI